MIERIKPLIIPERWEPHLTPEQVQFRLQFPPDDKHAMALVEILSALSVVEQMARFSLHAQKERWDLFIQIQEEIHNDLLRLKEAQKEFKAFAGIKKWSHIVLLVAVNTLVGLGIGWFWYLFFGK